VLYCTTAGLWYPVRLIQYHEEDTENLARWIVVLWRNCIFPASLDLKPDEWVEVPEADLVDDLWGDKSARMKICVSH
jgi:hypothetical protein